MSRLISSSRPVARKIYGCCACDWITGDINYLITDLGVTFAEKRAIVKARRNGWRIMPGEKHYRATMIGCDGELYAFRAIQAIHDICLAYDIYQDVC